MIQTGAHLHCQVLRSESVSDRDDLPEVRGRSRKQEELDTTRHALVVTYWTVIKRTLSKDMEGTGCLPPHHSTVIQNSPKPTTKKYKEKAWWVVKNKLQQRGLSPFKNMKSKMKDGEGNTSATATRVFAKAQSYSEKRVTSFSWNACPLFARHFYSLCGGTVSVFNRFFQFWQKPFLTVSKAEISIYTL